MFFYWQKNKKIFYGNLFILCSFVSARRFQQRTAIYNQHETDFEITAKRKNLGFHIGRITHLHEKSMNETSKNVVISCLQAKLDFKFRIRII